VLVDIIKRNKSGGVFTVFGDGSVGCGCFIELSGDISVPKDKNKVLTYKYKNKKSCLSDKYSDYRPTKTRGCKRRVSR